jgi:hypothetical protein
MLPPAATRTDTYGRGLLHVPDRCPSRHAPRRIRMGERATPSLVAVAKGRERPAIPAARRQVLYDSIIRAWQQPIGHLSAAVETLFFERAAQRLAGMLLLVVRKAHLVPPTRGRFTHSIPGIQGNVKQLRGIHQDGGGLLPAIPQGFEQMLHGAQGVIMEEGSHLLP